MRTISLNAWGGRALQPLMSFIRHAKATTDIFCLQEVHKGETSELRRRHPREFVEGRLFELIANDLQPEHRSFHATFKDDPSRMSLAMHIRTSMEFLTHDHFTIHEPKQRVETGSIILSPRKLQYAVVRINRKEVLVVNFHGIWTPDGKGDSEERLALSHAFRDFLAAFDMPQVILGDFNLEPDTKSLAILEQGRVNLVKKYGITSTRTVLYREFTDPTIGKFADYALVTPDIVVNKFLVLTEAPHICSDHAAMVLDFDVV